MLCFACSKREKKLIEFSFVKQTFSPCRCLSLWRWRLLLVVHWSHWTRSTTFSLYHLRIRGLFFFPIVTMTVCPCLMVKLYNWDWATDMKKCLLLIYCSAATFTLLWYDYIKLPNCHIFKVNSQVKFKWNSKVKVQFYVMWHFWL